MKANNNSRLDIIRSIDIVEVDGSSPLSPTIYFKTLWKWMFGINVPWGTSEGFSQLQQGGGLLNQSLAPKINNLTLSKTSNPVESLKGLADFCQTHRSGK